MGGLGNQMFQYAFGKSLALKHGVELKLDISLLGDDGTAENPVVRYFDLDVFNLKDAFATQQEIEKFNSKSNPDIIDRLKHRVNKIVGKYPLVLQKNHEYNVRQINSIGRNACIVGRWQSEDFFLEHAPEIRKVFSFDHFNPNEYTSEIVSQMKRGIAVSVHVRRGDYMTHPVYSKGLGCLDKQYYSDAVSLLNEKLSGKGKLNYYFISDDMDWCKANFREVEGAVFVEQEKNKTGYLSDFWLLTHCKHSIISNSTFSWWGAWLGEKQDSIIIAPGNWAKDSKFIPQNMIPERWKRLKNTFENI